jgi:hypothetical protein
VAAEIIEMNTVHSMGTIKKVDYSQLLHSVALIPTKFVNLNPNQSKMKFGRNREELPKKAMRSSKD